MRLNAYLARAGVASRRKADEFIKSGRVKVNDGIGQLNTEVKEGDRVELDGKPVSRQKLRYILMNKLRGTVTTLSDPHGRRTVLDLLAPHQNPGGVVGNRITKRQVFGAGLSISQRVVPVGRLDYDTTGALVLTNDGEMAHKLMHPSFKVKKTYIAKVSGEITEEKLENLRHGVRLEDGITAPATVRYLNGKVELTIHEGRKHQVKLMLAAVGLKVTSLHRTRYAGLTVDGLAPGKWRDLTKEEVIDLEKLVTSTELN